jgi:hypothetical protein
MCPIAHIGNIPVEEWLPFLVPVLALYLYGRRKERRRRLALRDLPDPTEGLDAGTVKLVMAHWSRAHHGNLSRAHLPLLYPPGPDGMNARELADRIHSDPVTVERLLLELEDVGYLTLEGQGEDCESQAWLTVEGYTLLRDTETALLSKAREPRPPRQGDAG